MVSEPLELYLQMVVNLPQGYWEPNPSPLQEQHVLLTAEPSLQLWKQYVLFFLKGYIKWFCVTLIWVEVIMRRHFSNIQLNLT